MYICMVTLCACQKLDLMDQIIHQYHDLYLVLTQNMLCSLYANRPLSLPSVSICVHVGVGGGEVSMHTNGHAITLRYGPEWLGRV